MHYQFYKITPRHTTIAAVAGDFDDDGSGVNTRVRFWILPFQLDMRFCISDIPIGADIFQSRRNDICSLCDRAHLKKLCKYLLDFFYYAFQIILYAPIFFKAADI